MIHLEAGSAIGSYRLIRQLGQGGMGTVWLAEHAMLGRRAAIKVLHDTFSTRTEIVTRFFNEARAATTIADPGIVQVFDFGHADERAYIVMEMLEGESLETRFRRHRSLAVGEVVRLMRQVASSLGAAHERGIVHRDLKPDNIFVVPDLEVPGGERTKILDFGIAKLSTTNLKTQTAAVMGTPLFMSPEQCRGAGQVDQRSDIYSVGCMMFLLLAGRAPFEAEGSGDLIIQHVCAPPPRLAMFVHDVPPELDALIDRCLAKDPALRPASGRELAVELGALLGFAASTTRARGVVSAPATSPTTLSSAASVMTPPRTRKRALAVAGVAVVAGALATVFALGLRSSSDATATAAAPIAHPPPDVPPSADAPPLPTKTPSDEISARMTAMTRAFVTWSWSNAGQPCPDNAALGGTRDLWDRPIEVTCEGQPANLVIGLISNGPDGQRDTDDDIVSWRLGHDVTEAIRGPRWKGTPVAVKPSRRERTPLAVEHPIAKPVPVAPAAAIVEPVPTPVAAPVPVITKPQPAPDPKPAPVVTTPVAPVTTPAPVPTKLVSKGTIMGENFFRQAKSAAKRGDCAAVRAIASRIAKEDSVVHHRVLADPELARCLK